MFQLLPYIVDMQNVHALSPSHGLRRASPLPEGAFAQITFFDTLKGGVFILPFFIILRNSRCTFFAPRNTME